MKTSERLVWMTATVLLAALSLYLSMGWRATEAIVQAKTDLLSSQVEAVSQSAALRAEVGTLKAQMDTLREQLHQAEARPIIALADNDISTLKSQGLKDPVSDLLADLQQRTDLFPFEAIAGGQMRFSPWLVNQHWVIAGVGDGHRGGWAILKYEVENGKVRWTLLEKAQESP